MSVGIYQYARRISEEDLNSLLLIYVYSQITNKQSEFYLEKTVNPPVGTGYLNVFVQKKSPLYSVQSQSHRHSLFLQDTFNTMNRDSSVGILTTIWN
jgi:hypothetical protein